MRPELLRLVLFIILIIQIVRVCIKYFKAEKVSSDTMICFIGTMGSGKTYMAVDTALKEYGALYRRYRLSKNFFIGRIYTAIYPDAALEPHLFSNIPILLHRCWWNRKKDIYCEVLTGEMLTLRQRIPPNSVVVFDEVSMTCNQFEYDNPLVMENVSMLARFCRQWSIKKFILTDQSLSIVKPIRERIALAYMLSDFHRFSFMPFFQTNVIPLLLVADQSTQLTATLEPYFFGVLPYKWWQRIFRTARYDTKCYSIIYEDGWCTIPPERFAALKTNYVIDVTSTGQDLFRYKKSKKEYRNDFMSNLGNI